MDRAKDGGEDKGKGAQRQETQKNCEDRAQAALQHAAPIGAQIRAKKKENHKKVNERRRGMVRATPLKREITPKTKKREKRNTVGWWGGAQNMVEACMYMCR